MNIALKQFIFVSSIIPINLSKLGAILSVFVDILISYIPDYLFLHNNTYYSWDNTPYSSNNWDRSIKLYSTLFILTNT